MSYDINYQDERFQQVESDKKAALSELNKTYDGMVSQSDKYYQAQVDASKQWQQTQTKLQQEQTDFAIDQIEQQKQQAQKDYTKEQSGAYVDWQKQSNAYGANAEAQAAQGMQNTGYAESSQVAMYTAYQNRVATAREAYNRVVMNYNNSITQARLQNNSALAEIAHQALQQQLELALQGFQYKNTLILEKANRKTELDQMYHSRWQDVLSQINTENALAEQVRQFNAQLAEEQRQFNQLHSGSSGGGGGGGRSRGVSGGGNSGDSGERKVKSSKGLANSSDGGKISGANNGSSGAATGVDFDSARKAAGGGAPSAKKMASLVGSGKVKESVKNGKLTFSQASIKDRLKTQKYSKYNF